MHVHIKKFNQSFSTQNIKVIQIVQTLKIVCSGFLIGTQFRQGRRTLGMTGFFKGTPGGAIPPPMGGGGGTGGAPKFNDYNKLLL